MLAIYLKKTDHDTKVNEIEKKITDHKHDKYITTPKFNKLTAENFAAKLAQADLVTKTDFNNKLSSLNKNFTSNKTKHLIAENELKKLGTFDSIYFCGKSHFDKDGTQNYLVFQPMYRITFISGNLKDFLTKELILLLHLAIKLQLSYYGTKTRVKFNGSCLKQDSVTFNDGKVLNNYIVYEINKSMNISDYQILENCLFGAVRLTKNADLGKYKYSEYGIQGFMQPNFATTVFNIGLS